MVKTINQLPAKNRQLRVLDSFVGYPTDVIQLEIDSKTKENKVYEEKIKSSKVCGIVALSFLLLALVSIGIGALGIALKWTILPVLYILFFALGVFSLVMTFVFLTRRSLHKRVGVLTDITELNDLRTKIEKYNITAKK